MTIHSAKGLEFPCVFIGGMEENLFPSSMSLYSREELEEERRLFYVAVTRAMTYLTISFASSRYKFGNLNYSEPSRFLAEIPKEIMALHGDVKKKMEDTYDGDFEAPVKRRIVSAGGFSGSRPTAADPNFQADDPSKIMVGSEVEHQRFGTGKVVALDGLGVNKMATIFFQGEGQKKLMLKFAKLKVLG
jgi:DNA helicase-2/ATP-dependent DNA helicase PcrA